MTISYDAATAAQKLADAIIRFGKAVGSVAAERSNLTMPQLLTALDDAKSEIFRLRSVPTGGSEFVDVFWDRQGWYFCRVDGHHDVSQGYEDLDACVRALIGQGYKLRGVRNTRGSVAQPKVPLPPRAPGGE